MPRGGLVAVLVALLVAGSAASPARAGGWQYDPASDLIYYGSVPVAPWYRARPSMMETGPWHQEGARLVPRCPHQMCGYPLPIHKAPKLVPVPVVRTYRVQTYRARPAAHVAWCAARYRSYDVRTDTFQPYHGPRRECRSPYR